MVKVIIKAKGARIGEKILSVTRKCMELAPMFPYFSWEFFRSHGRTYFSACYRDGDDGQSFEFPINNVDLDRYGYIIDQLKELEWSAVFWKKEEHE